MTIMMKQRFQALLYIVAILAAIQFTGCRSNSLGGEGPATGGILPPSSVAGQFTTAGEAGETSLASETPVIKVTWTNPTYAAAEFTVQLEYKKESDATYSMVDVGMDTSYVIPSVDVASTYNLRMKATTEDGELSEYALANVTVGGGTGGDGGSGTCPVAQGVNATAISPTQVQLSWTWSTSNYSEMTNYIVQRKLTSSTAWMAIQTITVNGAPAVAYSDNGAIQGEIHYRLVSDCAGNAYNSAASNAVIATTALVTPVINSVVPWITNQHKITFAYGGTPGANGHSGFQVESVVSNGYSVFQTISSTTSTVTYVLLDNTQCPAGQTVAYRIRATRTNLLLSSDWSAPYEVNCN